MELMVVGQPVPKSRPRVTYRKGRAWAYSEQPLVDYQDAVRALAFSKRQTDGGSIIPKGVPVRLRVSFILKGKQTSKPDLVNLVATIADALEGVWYDDDSQITELQCRKRQGKHPRVMITVEQVAEGAIERRE